jgi:hypothetical protein
MKWFAIVPLFIAVDLVSGCSATLTIQEVPGVYVPARGSYRSDTLFLYPYDPHLHASMAESKRYMGTYRHMFLDSANVLRIRDDSYTVTDSVLRASDASNRQGVLAVDLWNWHSKVKPDGFPHVLWFAMRRNDSILILPNFFYAQEEPTFVKVR